jgi:hypothetical protein
MSDLGKWNKRYKHSPRKRYGEVTTYNIAAEHLKDCNVVEDWGCGGGYFRKALLAAKANAKYIGIDGSRAPAADKIVDLAKYTSEVKPDGILLRHILEHNYEWKIILQNALTSFQYKLVVILFTPFTKGATRNLSKRVKGIKVPDLSFNY